MNVESYPPGPRETKNQTGNVWEWTLGDMDGYSVIRGGSWDDYVFGDLRADNRYGILRDYRAYVGFCCVAPPVLSEAEGPQDSEKK